MNDFPFKSLRKPHTNHESVVARRVKRCGPGRAGWGFTPASNGMLYILYIYL